jgi:quinol monooxygenase YgiN
MNFEILVMYTAKSEGDRELFVQEMKDSGILDAIRNEDGCIKYDYLYSDSDKCSLMLYEIWESKEHQKIHMTQPHMADAMSIKNKYISSVSLKELKNL